MDIQELKKKMMGLPVIPIGTEANDDQIIEGDELGCHYKITKEDTEPLLGRSFVAYSLSVSGPIDKQCELIKRFEELLGQMLLNPQQFPDMPGITFVLWDANRIDREGRLTK